MIVEIDCTDPGTGVFIEAAAGLDADLVDLGAFI